MEYIQVAPLLLIRKSESHMSGQYVIERELSLLVCYYVEERHTPSISERFYITCCGDNHPIPNSA